MDVWRTDRSDRLWRGRISVENGRARGSSGVCFALQCLIRAWPRAEANLPACPRTGHITTSQFVAGRGRCETPGPRLALPDSSSSGDCTPTYSGRHALFLDERTAGQWMAPADPCIPDLVPLTAQGELRLGNGEADDGGGGSLLSRRYHGTDGLEKLGALFTQGLARPGRLKSAWHAEPWEGTLFVKPISGGASTAASAERLGMYLRNTRERIPAEVIMILPRLVGAGSRHVFPIRTLYLLRKPCHPCLVPAKWREGVGSACARIMRLHHVGLTIPRPRVGNDLETTPPIDLFYYVAFASLLPLPCGPSVSSGPSLFGPFSQ